MRQTDISTERISSHYVVYDLTFILVDGGNSGGVTGCKNASEHSEVWKPLDILIGDVGTPPKLKHGLSPMVFVLEPNQVLTNFVFHGHKIPSGVYLRLIFFYRCATVLLNECVTLAPWHRFSQLSHLHEPNDWINWRPVLRGSCYADKNGNSQVFSDGSTNNSATDNFPSLVIVK